MSEHTPLQRAAIAQWLSRESKRQLERAKQELASQIGPGDRIHARINGEDIATVTMTNPESKEVPKITNPGSFTAWVAANKPEAIIQTVADWFTTTQNLTAIIETTGEIPDGVEIMEVTREPTLQVRINENQANTISEQIAGRVPYLTESSNHD